MITIRAKRGFQNDDDFSQSDFALTIIQSEISIDFESLADDLERVERLFKYIEYFMLAQFNAPRDRTEKKL